MKHTVGHLDGTPRYLYEVENFQEDDPVMDKKIVVYIAAALLLAMCLCMAACGRNAGNETKPGVTTEGSAQPTIRDDGVGSGRPNGGDATQPTTGGETTEATTEATTGATTDATTGGTTPSTEPTSPTTKPTDSDDDLRMSYQQYMALTSKQQQEFFDKYFAEDPLGFAQWFQKVKAEYDEGKQEVIATGPIDIGDYINP